MWYDVAMYKPDPNFHAPWGYHYSKWHIDYGSTVCQTANGTQLPNPYKICPLCMYNMAKDELPIILIKDWNEAPGDI